MICSYMYPSQCVSCVISSTVCVDGFVNMYSRQRKAYQTSASFVPKLATVVLEWLDVQKDDVILDIGCGGKIMLVPSPVRVQIAIDTHVGPEKYSDRGCLKYSYYYGLSVRLLR